MRLPRLGPKARICFPFASRTALDSMPCFVRQCCGWYFGVVRKASLFSFHSWSRPRLHTPRTGFQHEKCSHVIPLRSSGKMRREKLAPQRMSEHTSKPKGGMQPGMEGLRKGTQGSWGLGWGWLGKEDHFSSLDTKSLTLALLFHGGWRLQQ